MAEKKPTLIKVYNQEQRISRKLAKKAAQATKTKLKLFPERDEIGKFYRFKAKRGTESVVGTLGYDKPSRSIQIGYVGKRRPEGSESSNQLHSKVKNKTMSRRFIEGSLKELKKRFPKAETVGGVRVTGAKTRFREGHQEFKLPKLEKVRSTAEAIGEGLGESLGKVGKVAEKVGKVGTKASIVGTALDFIDFYRTMEKAKKKRARARQGFLPGGRT